MKAKTPVWLAVTASLPGLFQAECVRLPGDDESPIFTKAQELVSNLTSAEHIPTIEFSDISAIDSLKIWQESSIKRISYDFSDDIIKENFYSQKEILTKLQKSPVLAHDFYCFEGDTKGHFLFLQKQHFVLFKDCDLSKSQFVTFLTRLVEFARSLQSINAVLVLPEPSRLGCVASDPTQPIINDPYVFYGLNQTMYVDSKLSKIARMFSKETRGEEKVMTLSSKAWEALSLLRAFVFLSETLLARWGTKTDLVYDAQVITAFKLRTAHYLNELEKGVVKGLRLEVIEDLLISMDDPKFAFGSLKPFGVLKRTRNSRLKKETHTRAKRFRPSS